MAIQWNPFWEATLKRGHPSGKATWQCKSKHKCIDFYPWREATPLERPLFWCKRGGLTRGVPLYTLFSEALTLICCRDLLQITLSSTAPNQTNMAVFSVQLILNHWQSHCTLFYIHFIKQYTCICIICTLYCYFIISSCMQFNHTNQIQMQQYNDRG